MPSHCWLELVTMTISIDLGHSNPQMLNQSELLFVLLPKGFGAEFHRWSFCLAREAEGSNPGLCLNRIVMAPTEGQECFWSARRRLRGGAWLVTASQQSRKCNVKAETQTIDSLSLSQPKATFSTTAGILY